MRERITWYEGQVRRQRIGFFTSEILVVLLSASIPASAAAGSSTAVVGVLGALVVVTVGMRQLFRWGEDWIRLSGALRALEGEFVHWRNGAAPYQDPAEASSVLASRVEALILSETTEWAGTRRAAMAAAESAQQPQPQPPAAG